MGCSFLGVILVALLGAPAAKGGLTGLNLDGSQATVQWRQAREAGCRKASPPNRIYLRRTVGHLTINGQATTDLYEAYFHIPVPYREQAVLSVDVQSAELVDYRLVRLTGDNVIVAARLHRAASTTVDWTVYVLVNENTYADLPAVVPIPTPEQLPDSVRAWLSPTDCTQIEAPIVQETAQRIRGTKTNLIELAEAVCAYCDSIPWTFPHSPSAFDAVYALNWGNSCTGHAHAAAALMRANGVPARVLLNIPTWYNGWFDMHWCTDYFVPGYGWVRMEPSLGTHPYQPQDEIVTLACNPEDEFPLFYPCGIEGNWHTSDPALGTLNPDWGGAHRGYNMNSIASTPERITLAHALTDSAFAGFERYQGTPLTSSDQTCFQLAQTQVANALSRFIASDLDGFLAAMELAVSEYAQIQEPPAVTLYQDDFETGDGGWTHGGTHDEWECGTPLDVPQGAHSGSRCWGMDLDGSYENSANCWLLSPWVDLRNHVAPTLSFYVWNWVQDQTQGYVHDPLWVEITRDGTLFEPICSQMGGVNDDPAIPDVGGWNRIVLDISRYAGSEVRFRFHFSSNASVVEIGSYIDDVEVRGRMGPNAAVAGGEVPARTSLAVAPNPFADRTELQFRLAARTRIRLEVFDPQGTRVRTVAQGERGPGAYRVAWDGRDDGGTQVPAGAYFCRLAADRVQTARVLLIR